MTVTTGRTAFVAGATGYTGRAVVEELRRRSVATVAHVRPDSTRLQHWRDHFESMGAVVDVTPWEDEPLAATMSRIAPDAVFALLGTTRARMRQSQAQDTYESVDYGLTAMLLRAVRRAAPSARFIHLSAIGVGAGARGDYLRVRWRMEQELRASGVDWIIVRPAFITGAEREDSRPLERGAAALTDAILRVAGWVGASRLRARYGSITAAELARALVHHAFEPASSRRVLGTEALR